MTREREIEIVERKLADPNIPAKDVTSLSRRLAVLRGEVTPGEYTRRSINSVGAVTESTERRKLKKTAEPKAPGEPLWQKRLTLVCSVGNRLLNASELVLTPEEAQMCVNAEFTREQLLQIVKDWIFDTRHADEFHLLRDSFGPSNEELALQQQAADRNAPGAWVVYLKAYPQVIVTAGPTLTRDELQDVVLTRARIAEAKEKVRREIYERFPDRWLRPYKTVAEYDAAHPDSLSIVKQHRPEFSKFPHEWFDSYAHE